MTLVPVIVALCVNTGPTYTEACKAALEQGAAQSGFAGHFEKFSKKIEKDAIRYVNPCKEVEIAAAVIGYTVQLASGRQATIALPNPGIKDSSLSLSVGESGATVGFRIGF